MQLIIDNTITPYAIARYNQINRRLQGKLIVWFQAETDLHRHWERFPKIEFEYLSLRDRPVRFVGQDIHTFHINPDVPRLLSKLRPKLDRVVCTGWDTATYWYVILYCSLHHLRCTLWSGSTRYERSLRRQLTLPLVKLLIKLSADYIAYGTRARDYLISLGANPAKIQIFLNNVDVAYYRRQAKQTKSKARDLRHQLHLSPKNKVFLFVGQLIHRKGILELLQAFKQVQADYPHTSLVIVGRGPLRPQIESLINRLALSEVILVDHQEYDQLPVYYQLCDALIMPSHQEVWGLVTNEALASGKPAIVSATAGCSTDLITPYTGYIIPKITPESIAVTCKLFLKKPITSIPVKFINFLSRQDDVISNFP